MLGDYQGDGSVCGDIACPAPIGACCVGTICVENSTVSQCEAFSGHFMEMASRVLKEHVTLLQRADAALGKHVQF